ncbi:hypothetical protein HI914_05469 [Erysiphe necator]|nr:hypothetical protein HI914_05469 [Erysiphe necator]
MEMTTSISTSELETVRAHTASRLPRVLDEPPNPLSAVVVFRKDSSSSAKTPKGDLTTKKSTDVAPPFNSKPPSSTQQNTHHLQLRQKPTSPKFPSLLESNPSLSPQSLSKPSSQIQNLRPHRRLEKSNPCVFDTSCAKTVLTVPKLQKNRRKTTTNNVNCYRKERIKYSPPLSMVTQGFYSTSSPTTSWVAQQSRSIGSSRASSLNYETRTLSLDSAHTLNNRFSFKSLSSDKVSSPMTLDTDSCRSDPTTAQMDKNLDGAPNKMSEKYDETNSDESDLYLMAAKEEETHKTLSMKSGISPTISRQSCIKYDLLPPNTNYDTAASPRYESDYEQLAHVETLNKHELYGYNVDFKSRSGDEKVNMNQEKYRNTYNGLIRSDVKDQNLKPYSPNQQPSCAGRRLLVSSAFQQAGGRRSSVPDAALCTRSGNRQLKGFSAPHAFYSSPLVPRNTEVQELSELGRQIEDTESTYSTTVQSTVWDELDDLKSRIHRLESVGKFHMNVGTENFRASSDRPLTATTTVTTMSTSPKRDGANSKPSKEQNLRASGYDTSQILKSALTKSKLFLDPDIYRILEITASDAISLCSMIGNLGQPGSNTQSHPSSNFPTTISDRQVRRKAECMCRSLTELCLALSEINSANEKAVLNITSHEISNRSTLISPKTSPSRQSPRPLSQLEVRRSNLLAPSVANSLKTLPDFEDKKANSHSSRRTSLLIRGGRDTFDEFAEDKLENRRASSRVFSEAHSTRKSFRDKIYPFNFSEKTPLNTSESILPLRRNNSSASHSTSPVPNFSSFSRWRKSDQNQIERNRVSSIVSRVIEDQENSQSSFVESPTLESSHSLTRRTRHLSPNDFTSAGQRIGFH